MFKEIVSKLLIKKKSDAQAAASLLQASNRSYTSQERGVNASLSDIGTGYQENSSVCNAMSACNSMDKECTIM